MSEAHTNPPQAPRPLSAAAFPARLSPSATRAMRALERRFEVRRLELFCFVLWILNLGGWISGLKFGIWCLVLDVWFLSVWVLIGGFVFLCLVFRG